MSAIEHAMAFLREELSEGPRPALEVRERARRAGVSGRTLDRALRRVGVVSEKTGWGASGRWVCRLPDQLRAPTLPAAPRAPHRILTAEMREALKLELDRRARERDEAGIVDERDRLLFADDPGYVGHTEPRGRR